MSLKSLSCEKRGERVTGHMEAINLPWWLRGVKCLSAALETWVQFPDREDAPEKANGNPL